MSKNYRVTSSGTLNVRSGPSSSFAIVGTLPANASVPVICQARGQLVGTTSVWDSISTGGFVSDRYISTPSSTTFSSTLPRCSYPGQVSISTPVNTRSGPGTSYAVNGSVQGGGLAYVACQKAGTTVGTSTMWNQLVDGRWLSDYYISNASSRTYSAPVPRCP